MKEIPIKQFPRQSLSVVLEGSLYELSLKECNGIMAVTVVRDGVTIVSNRRAVAGMPVIPAGYLENGNFVILTNNDDLPYYTGFEGSNTFIYLTMEEMSELQNSLDFSLPAGSVPSGPLVDFNYLSGKLAYGMALARSTVGTYIQANALKTAAINAPRYESDGLLIENSTFNITTPSEGWSASANAVGAWSHSAPDSSGWVTVTGSSNTGASEGSYRDFVAGATVQNGTATLSIDVKKVVGYNFRLRAYVGGSGSDGIGNTDGAFIDGQPLPSSSVWEIEDNGDWLRISLTRGFGGGTSIFRIYPFGSQVGASGSLTYRRTQVEKTALASSYVKTTSTAVSRAADLLTMTQPGAKWLYREYIPLGGALIKELTPYTGELCPPGHLQKLKAWNRDLTAAEIKELGVANV